MIAAHSLVAMTRIVHAPRAHVFAAWRRPERMARWWTAEHAGGHAEPCGGGAFRIGTVVVALVEEHANDRIVFAWGPRDRALASLVEVTFADLEEGTELCIRQIIVPARD